MALVGLQNVSVGFGGDPLLENMNLQIEAGERICLIGRNGAGKTTLMRLLLGEIEPEHGILSRSPGLAIASLTQEVPGDLPGTVFDLVSAGLGEKGKLLAEYHLLSHRIAAVPHDNAMMRRLDQLQHALDADNGWHMNRHVERILEHMALDSDAEFNALSAGMKRRVLLAQAIVGQPDLLLLDEPTNHLDIKAIAWLEDFLAAFGGSILFVSHDRAFLKRLATRMIELDRGRLTSYSCDYETCLKRKQIALDAEASEQALFDKKLAQEEIWIRKGIKARRTRNEGRVRALEKMREERSRRKEQIGAVRMQTQDAKLSGNRVIEAKHISFGYAPDTLIISDFSAAVMRGDKIGIIGPNGSGKTTLIRLLLEELKPRQGTVRHGANLEIAYFDQLHSQLDFTKSVFENVADGNETVFINGSPRHIIGYLQDFLFTPTQSRNPVADLSGGERNRLLLARLFTKPSNVLVLDEPTNNLDIETLDLLEECLMNYPGTVLMVSHDREFLNNVVTSTFVLEGSGIVKEYVGGYDDWLRQRKIQAPIPLAAPQSRPRPEKSKSASDVPRKLTYQEKKDLESLPAHIESLETEQKQIHDAMASPEYYKTAPTQIAAYADRLEDLQSQLAAAYARWQWLEERNV